MKNLNFVYLIFIVLSFLVACDEDTTIGPGGITTTLSNSTSNNMVTQGGEVTFTVSAVTTPNKTIRYVWDSSGGTIIDISVSKDTVVWTAPEELAEYQISVTAFDGEFSIKISQDIEVSEYVPTSSPA